MSNPEKFRDRKFIAVLYPEDPTHVECIERLKAGGYNFAAILHDKDVYEEGDNKGELKKPHWHLVLRFKNAVWNTAVAKELGITPNYLEACKDFDNSLVYLVHYHNPEKAQYDHEDVFGPLKLKLESLLADTDEGTRVKTLIDIVKNSPGPIGVTELMEKAVASGLYADLRRMGHLATCLVREHNDEFYRETQSNAGVTISREAFEEYLRWTSSKTDDIQPL